MSGAVARPAPAGELVPRWSRDVLEAPWDERSAPLPLALAQLVDGTLLAVVRQDPEHGYRFLCLDREGKTLSSVFHRAHGGWADVAPEGDVFLTTRPGSGKDLWVDRLDGRTGRSRWPAPQRVAAPTDWPLAREHLGLLPSGDVILVATHGRPVGGPPGGLAVRISGATGTAVWTIPLPDGWHSRTAMDRDGNLALSVRPSSSRGALLLVSSGRTGREVYRRVYDDRAVEGIDFDLAGRLLVRTVGADQALESLDVHGDLAWSLSLGPMSGDGTGLSRALEATPDGEAVVVDRAWVEAGSASTRISKVSPGGRLLWRSSLPARDVSLYPDEDGRLLAVGSEPAGTTFLGTLSAAGEPIWQASLRAHEERLVVRERESGDVFVLRREGQDTCLLSRTDGQTGHLVFERTIPGEMLRPVVVRAAPLEDDVLVVRDRILGSWVREMERRDAATGERVWGPVTFEGAGPSSGFVTDGSAVLSTKGGGLVSVDGNTGAVLWERPLAVPGWSIRTLAPGPDRVLGVGLSAWTGTSHRSAAALLDAGDGHLIWGPRDVIGGYESAVLVAADGSLFLWANEDARFGGGQGAVARFDRDTGAELWRHTSSALASYSRPLLSEVDGDLIVAGLRASEQDGYALRLDGATGRIEWSASRPGWAFRGPGGDVFLAAAPYDAGNWRTSVSRLNAGTGELDWAQRGVAGPELFAGRPSGLVALGGEDPVVLLTPPDPLREGQLVKLSGRTGEVLLRRAASGKLLVPGPGGVLVGSDADPHARYLLTLYTESLGIEALGAEPPRCGRPFERRLLARNGEPPYAFEVASGALPPGLRLNAADGTLEGGLLENGDFTFEARVRDSRGETAARGFRIEVAPTPDAPLVAERTLICRGASTRLLLPDGYVVVEWRPGGGAGPLLEVSPERSTPYQVLADGPDGCRHTGTVRIDVTATGLSPPHVVPPPSVAVLQTICAGRSAGASPESSSDVAGFLSGGTASDDCGAMVTRLPPLVDGVEVLPSTVFPAGGTAVTFRFRDEAGNVGTAAGGVTVFARGDLDLSLALDVLDLVTLAAFLAGDVVPGWPPFTAPSGAADVDGDGLVDVRDLVTLAAYLAGNLGCLPP